MYFFPNRLGKYVLVLYVKDTHHYKMPFVNSGNSLFLASFPWQSLVKGGRVPNTDSDNRPIDLTPQA